MHFYGKRWIIHTEFIALDSGIQHSKLFAGYFQFRARIG